MYEALTDQDIAWFLKNINKNGPIMREGFTPCWEWTHYTLSGGYGGITIGGKSVLVHRLAYYLEHGELPEVVMHDCDNPPCVRHLTGGDHIDNINAAIARGRVVHGENHHKTHLSDDDVREIRRLYRETPMSQRDLGKKFNVSHQSINAIIRHRVRLDA